MKKKNVRVKVTETGFKVKKKIIKLFNKLPKTTNKENKKEEIIIDSVLIDDKFLLIPLYDVNNYEPNPYGIFNNHIRLEPPIKSDEFVVCQKWIKGEINFYKNIKPNTYFSYRGDIFYKKFMYKSNYNQKTIDVCSTIRISDGKSFKKVIAEERKMRNENSKGTGDLSKFIKQVVVTPLKLKEETKRGEV